MVDWEMDRSRDRLLDTCIIKWIDSKMDRLDKDKNIYFRINDSC